MSTTTNAVMIFNLSSGAGLATVVGVLIEVPIMLMLVGFCKRTTIGSTGHPRSEIDRKPL